MTPTPERVREAFQILSELGRHPASDRITYLSHTKEQLSLLADELEEAAKPKPLTVAASIRGAGGAVYVDIPGEGKVVAIYVGTFSDTGRYHTSELEGYAEDWGQLVSL